MLSGERQRHVGVENLVDLTDAQCLECIQSVHKFWQQHRSRIPLENSTQARAQKQSWIVHVRLQIRLVMICVFSNSSIITFSKKSCKTDSGFNRRLKDMMQKRHAKDEALTLTHLRESVSDESDEQEQRFKAMFSYLSVVELLPQYLSDCVQSVMEEDMFVRETDLWNQMAGPIFRCELLVNTQCLDLSNDACFSSRPVVWPGQAPNEFPLLVQAINSDEYFSAKLHRYSCIRRAAVLCSQLYSHICVSTTKRLDGFIIENHAEHQSDVKTVGLLCMCHVKHIIRAASAIATSRS